MKGKIKLWIVLLNGLTIVITMVFMSCFETSLFGLVLVAAVLLGVSFLAAHLLIYL